MTVAEARVVLVRVADGIIDRAGADLDRRLRACGASTRDFAALSAALFVARMECLLLIDRLLADAQRVH